MFDFKFIVLVAIEKSKVRLHYKDKLSLFTFNLINQILKCASKVVEMLNVQYIVHSFQKLVVKQ